MIPVQFRPKYGIEQYVITFQFPEGSTGDVKLAVEVEIGEPGLLLGPVFRFQYTVSVGIAGGVPGSVYRILCSFGDMEFVGRVAVKESAAVVPEGASVAPFTQAVTTPPYVVLVEDSLSVSGTIRDGYLWKVPHDHVAVALSTLDGSLRNVIQTMDVPDEHVTVSFQTLDGHVIGLVVVPFDVQDGMSIHASALDGTRVRTVIPYLNYDPEPITISMTTLDGTKV